MDEEKSIRKAIKHVAARSGKKLTKIQKMKFDDAFLLVWDYVKEPGRTHFLNKYYSDYIGSKEDFQQLMLIGALDACKGYDFKRGINIKAYFWITMRNHICSALHYAFTRRRHDPDLKKVSLNEDRANGEITLADDLVAPYIDPADKMHSRDRTGKMLKMLAGVSSPMERNLLKCFILTTSHSWRDNYKAIQTMMKDAYDIKLTLKQIDNGLVRLRRKAHQIAAAEKD